MNDQQAPAPRARVQDSIPGLRPRIRQVKFNPDLYECSDGVVTRAARTKEGAYHRWLTAALRELQDKLRPSWPTEAEVVTAKRKPRAVKGKAPDPIQPPAHTQPPRPPAPPAYTGPVTVVPGTAARKTLQLPTALRVNGLRAAAVQPRMVSMSGGTPREEGA